MRLLGRCRCWAAATAGPLRLAPGAMTESAASQAPGGGPGLLGRAMTTARQVRAAGGLVAAGQPGCPAGRFPRPGALRASGTRLALNVIDAPPEGHDRVLAFWPAAGRRTWR